MRLKQNEHIKEGIVILAALVSILITLLTTYSVWSILAMGPDKYTPAVGMSNLFAWDLINGFNILVMLGGIFTLCSFVKPPVKHIKKIKIVGIISALFILGLYVAALYFSVQPPSLALILVYAILLASLLSKDWFPNTLMMLGITIGSISAYWFLLPITAYGIITAFIAYRNLKGRSPYDYFGQKTKLVFYLMLIFTLAVILITNFMVLTVTWQGYE